MANLLRRQDMSARRAEAVTRIWDDWLNCDIRLIDMNWREDGGDYNWLANTGGLAEPVVLFEGPAQMQVYRFTLVMDAPVGSVDQVRTARFTVGRELLDPAMDIRKGMQIRVLACDHNPSLETYEYVVSSGLNSGSNFRRTIECEVDMARIVPREGV